MRYIVLFLLPYIAIFLQSTIFSFYSIKGAIPDLVLVFVVFFALLNGAYKGTVYGFLCGLMEDLYMGRFIGINALSKGLTAYILGKLQGNVFKENIFVGVMGVFIGTILNSCFLFLLSIVSFETFHIDISMLFSIFYQGLYNILISAPIYIWYYNSSKKGILRPSEER